MVTRRKVALAVLIPIALAAVFGGLRVRNDLADADSYSASASQVTVLRPAVAYLAAVENAIVVAREKASADDPDRDAAIELVVAAGDEFVDAVQDADLTSAQRAATDTLLERSGQLREPMGYASTNQSVAKLDQLQADVASLIDAIIAEQQEPELRLELLGSVIDGRVSLAIQQFTVAFQDGKGVKPIDLAAEVGVEASAIDRIAAVLGFDDENVSALRAQNATHFGTVREGGTDLGDATAYAPYDRLTRRSSTASTRAWPAPPTRRSARPWSTRSSRWPRCSPRSSWPCWSRACCWTRSAGCVRARSRSPRRSCRRRSVGSVPVVTRARSSRSTSPRTRRWASWPARSTTCTARPSTWPPARPPCVPRSARCSRRSRVAAPRS